MRLALAILLAILLAGCATRLTYEADEFPSTLGYR
jgi:hypothetical protein